MHITLVSQCEKRALKRTRALIDRYAIRISDRSWVTPITTEALDDLRLALRASATRQTAIACYINKGRQSMKLAWTIGRADAFGLDGALAVATRQRPHAAPPPWLRTAALVVKAAGLAHDLGKGSAHFQQKLERAVNGSATQPIKDETRHEWVSMKLYQAMRDQNDFSWSGAWARVGKSPNKRDMPFDDGRQPIASVFDAVDFAVLTHHGLLGPKKKSNQSSCPYGAESGEHTKRPDAEGKDGVFTPANTPLADGVLINLAKTTERLCAIARDRENDTDKVHYWRAIAIISRAALILADHEISAMDLRQNNNPKKTKPVNDRLWANTGKMMAGSHERIFNQTLDWHLENVSLRAQSRIHLFYEPLLPGLSRQTVDEILSPSGGGRFQWQDEATAHFEQTRDEAFQPTLIFSLAGTGAGKTRMNVKALAALRREDEPLRIAAGFNLRTLTLQTHRAFQTQMSMGDEEVACVIGDYFTKVFDKDRVEDTDENLSLDDPKENYDLTYETSPCFAQDYPQWLTEMAAKKSELTNLIGVPVLVSTMDYLVNAGDPSKQGHHAHALLRIASSDLILDEVDSYDPESLVAVLRVVQMAGLFGRHVIASSATLCEPVAKAIFEAYQSGVAMFASLRGNKTRARISFIDNQLAPFSFCAGDTAHFVDEYKNRLERLVVQTQTMPVYRKNQFCTIAKGTKEQPFSLLVQAVENSMKEMHKHNAWTYDDQSDKRASFGLVRVASVKNCVALAAALNQHPHLHVTAYHSVDLRLRRTLKEQALDRLFNRNPNDGRGGNGALLDDPDIRQRVNATEGNDVIFIVVATPVEEVGRDHDFDWAVIEPSSVQSIVQLAGRVNRHRLIPVDNPNIAILQFNYRTLCGESRVFQRPGNEVGGKQYKSHDVIELLGEKTSRIDAALRFGDTNGQCSFAIEDDDSVKSQLEKPVQVVLADQKAPLAWITRCHYQRYPLRAENTKRKFRILFNDVDRVIVTEQGSNPNKGPKETPWIETMSVRINDQIPNKPYWLAPGLEEIIHEAALLENKLMTDLATEFETYATNSQIVFDAWLGGY